MTGAVALMVLFGAVLVAGGVAVIEIAERGADGRLGRNGWAGIRTRATRSSDEAWSVAHRAGRADAVLGGRLMAAAALVAAAVGLLVGDGDGDRTLSAWGIAIAIGGVVGAAVTMRGAWRGHQAARQLDAPGS